MKILKTSIIEQFDRDTLDAAKGVLILAVVLGHIRLLTDNIPSIFMVANNFHVICFLLFPFLYNIRDLSKDSFDTWVGRYLFPFILFLELYSIINFLFIVPDASMSGWITTLLYGVTIGNATWVDAATGMQSLWFLPTLFALVVVLSFLRRIAVSFAIILFGGIILHGVIDFIPEETQLSIPYGLVLIAYLLPLGLCVRWLFCCFGRDAIAKYSAFFFLGWIAFQLIASFYTHSRVGFAMMRLQSFEDVGQLLLHDGLILCSFLFLVTTRRLRGSAILKYLGKNSLAIYLFHHFIYGVLYTVLYKTGTVSGTDDPSAVLYGLIMFPTVLGSSILAVELCRKLKLIEILFPRKVTDLKEIRL